jgi:hypothetical protein
MVIIKNTTLYELLSKYKIISFNKLLLILFLKKILNLLLSKEYLINILINQKVGKATFKDLKELISINS